MKYTQKIFDSLSKLAREGMESEKMALCIALGIVLGIFPILGATTLMCTIAALAFRLNLPLIQLVNYAVYPVQIILLVPFYGAGSWVFTGNLPVDVIRQMIASLQNDFWGSMHQLGDLTLYAVFVWLVVSPAIVWLAYAFSKPAVAKIQSTVKRAKLARDLSNNPT